MTGLDRYDFFDTIVAFLHCDELCSRKKRDKQAKMQLNQRNRLLKASKTVRGVWLDATGQRVGLFRQSRYRRL